MSKSRSSALLFILLLISVLLISCGGNSKSDTDVPVPDDGERVAELFPIAQTVLGTQAFSANYTFDNSKSQLIEQADIVRNAGFRIFKFGLSPRNFSAWEDNHLGQQSFYDLPAMDQYQSLADIAQNEPSVRHALDLDFDVICMWTYVLSGDNEFPDSTAAYDEIYNLTRDLLTRYNDSGRLFMLGHWEGDWWVMGDFDGTRLSLPPNNKDAYINWVRNRQAAIENARNDTPHNNVWVAHYIEVNRVSDFIDFGYERLVNGVLPEVKVDAVSYSAYDAGVEDIARNLDAIESHANFSNYLDPLFSGKKTFIGEFGFSIRDGEGTIIRDSETQAELAMSVLSDYNHWGAPLAFYWQLYNNETSNNGEQAGWWLIDDQNVEQPVYEAFKLYINGK